MIPCTSVLKKANSGLTLLEVAIAVTIVGVMMATAIDLYNRVNQQRRIETTYDNMDMIVQALSTYTETAGRVPCPANPAAADQIFGWEYGITLAALQVNAGHFPVGSCGTLGSVAGGAVNPTEGIVPFMTLGLPPTIAQDGWGHYFTYAVSPVFAKQNDQATGAIDTGTFHGRCRHAGWVNLNDKYNRNAVKARFCCADQTAPIYDAGTDLVINHTAGGALSPLRTANSVKSDGSGNFNVDNLVPVYNDIDIPTTKNSVPTFEVSPPGAAAPKEMIEAPAFVLVSHGPYGYGAYLGNNSASRIPVPAGYTTELKNVHIAATNTYVDGPTSATAGAGYFDHIVRWMTQDGVLSAHGALSCDYP